ncbi:trans-2-enoyl-CoA reductase [Ramaria rubella]|nr:trans-2-enoyl-CoA reductase [Ramaria rubella]
MPKAIVYSSHGDPTKVLRAVSLPPLPSPPPPGTINVRYLLSPINPADLNTIEGVYPSKPSLRPTSATKLHEPVYVAGNEGLGQVVELGHGVNGLKEGDWVVMTKSQSGTWQSKQNVPGDDVLRVPREKGTLTEVHGSTLTVNPPTAYGMLTGFVKLEPGDYVIQNGANSAVGQAVIQIASYLGFKSINFVRSRPEAALTALKSYLTSLGATHVFTYDDLSNKALNLRSKIPELTGGKGIKLGLNCVGGKENSLMAGLLGQDAHLVSYGAMSKQPLSLPTSLHIFKNLTSHGYWQTRWYSNHSHEEREEMVKFIVRLMEAGKLREPEHEIVPLAGSNEEIGEQVRGAIARLAVGAVGKKLLLAFEDPKP